MDYLTFLTKIVEFSAWPIVALVIAKSFRQEIVVAMPFLKRLKLGQAEAEFDRNVQEVKQEIEEVAKVAEPLSVKDDLSNPESGQDVTFSRGTVLPLWKGGRWLQTAEIKPAAAILGVWNDLEAQLAVLIRNMDVEVPSGQATSIPAWIDSLYRANIIAGPEMKVLKNLYDLRNQAAHDNSLQPTRDTAISYVMMALALQDVLIRRIEQ